jgi:basic membrane protein A and related proteins
VIFVAAGKGGLGAIDQVKSRPGVYMIGVDSNQDALAPGKILTSMVKQVDIAVLQLEHAAAAHHAAGGNLVFGLRDNAVGLTDFQYTRNVMTPARLARLDALKKALETGKIVAPATREELATFKPLRLP